MEKIYEDLKKSGHNTVDNIINWMKSAEIMHKDSESTARKMLEEASKEAKVEFEKFQYVVQRMATENKKDLEQVEKQLASQGPKLKEAFEAAAKAFADVMSRK